MSDTDRISRLSVMNQRFRKSMALVQERMTNAILSFLTLETLFGLFISLGGIVADFLQAYSLIRYE